MADLGLTIDGEPPGYLEVIDDYGKVGEGATNARYVLAENGNEYLIKGPSLVAGHPTVAANEWIAARLADSLGLPVLDFRLVTMGGNLFFASTWMQRPSFSPAITEDLLVKCENKERIYDVVVFDAWLCNLDRHAHNLVVRKLERDVNSKRHWLLLNDHSHLLVSPLIPSLDLLEARLDSLPSLYARRLPFIRDRIRSPKLLEQSIARAEATSDAAIRYLVGSTPEALLPAEYRDRYRDFVIGRRDRLRGVFHRDADSFPNLRELT